MNSNWKECKLGDVVDIVPGYAFKSEHFGEIGQSVVKITNINPPYINVDGAKKVDLAFYNIEKLKNYFLRPNEFAVAMTGATIGKVGKNISNETVILNQRVAKISPLNSVDHHFIYYCIQGNDFQEFIQNNIDSHSAQENISGTSIARFPILLPPLPEQRAIAGVLGSLDDKIDLLHRQNKTLEGMAEALWRKMFVPACAGDPHADREEADPNWKKGKLGNIAEINPLRSIKKRAIAIYLDMSNMPTNGPFPKEWIKREFTSGMKFKNGDTVIARITPCLENGKTAYVNFLNNEEIAWGSTEYIVLAPKTGYHSEWYYFLARNDDFRDFAIQNMTGTSGRQRVSGESVAQYEITIPPSKYMEQFGEFAMPVMEHIKHNSFQIRSLSRLRDTLLPKLMSGELRVPI